MSGKATAATDRVSIASAPAAGPVTVCAWIRLTSTTNATNTIMRFDASGGTALIAALRSLVPGFYSAASTTGVVGTATTTGTWLFVCGTRDAANAGQLLQGATPGTQSKTTATVSSSGTPGSVNVFGRSTSDATDWFVGSIAYMRVWTAILSDAEIAAESLMVPSVSTPAARTTNLWASWPFAAAALTDVSGNSRNLTAGTTPLTADTDPPLGHSTALGRASETDTASALTRAKSKAIVRASETDTASALTRTKNVTLGRAIETDTAAAVTRSKSRALVRASETDTAAALTRAKVVGLGRAAETDTGTILTRSKSVALGRPTETDTAQGVTRTKSTALVRATETDTSGTLTRSKQAQLGRSAETDTAGQLGLGTAIVLGRAVETDTATTLSRSKRVALNRASTLSTAGTLSRGKSVTIGRSSETDTGRPVSLTKSEIVLGRALETDTALPVQTGQHVDMDLQTGPVEESWLSGEIHTGWHTGAGTTQWASGGVWV